jgi:hypothetical protein
MSARRAALGFSVHTGWAVAVLVAGPAAAPEATPKVAPQALLRRRLDLCGDSGKRFSYHRAAEVLQAGRPLADAEAIVQAARDNALQYTRAALAALLEGLPAEHRPAAAGIVLGNAPLPADLAAILKAHPRVHAAEGALFREAIASACNAQGLALLGVPGKALAARAEQELKRPAAALAAGSTGAGRALGRPWARDEKDAFLVAWLALAAAPRRH